MLARLQNQPKNNAGIDAACVACRAKGRDGGIGRDISIKIQTAIIFAIAKPAHDQGRPLSATNPKNLGIYAVQALTLHPHL